MKLFPIAATLALTLAMPALACDEDITGTTTGTISVSTTPSVYAVSPGMFAFTGDAVAVTADDDSDRTITIHSNDNGNDVEIKIVNENIDAKVNGKAVPADRVTMDDKGVTIVDENGEVIYHTNLRFMGGAGAVRGFTFDNQWDEPLAAYNNWLTFSGDEDAALFETPKVMLGVHMDSTGPALEKQLHLEAGVTTLIMGVYEGLPASAGGIEPYDIIVKIGDAAKADPESVRELLRAKEPGDVIELDVIRGGKKEHLSITLEDYDAKRMHEATFLGSANDVFGEGPSGLNPLILTERQGPGNSNFGVFVQPDRLQRWRDGSLAAADNLRREAVDRLRSMNIDEESLHAQIEELRARLDEMSKMMHKMVEDAAEAKDRVLGENES